MKRIEKISLVCTKVCEALHWALAALLLFCLVMNLPARLQEIPPEVTAEYAGQGFSLYGLDMTPVGPDGVLRWAGFYEIFLGVALICGMTALVFRLANQIIRQSREVSPFCPENRVRIKRLGLLAIAIPVVKVITSVAVSLTGNASGATMSLHLDQLSLGLAVLCLTQYFARGEALERDVEGLV